MMISAHNFLFHLQIWIFTVVSSFNEIKMQLSDLFVYVSSRVKLFDPNCIYSLNLFPWSLFDSLLKQCSLNGRSTDVFSSCSAADRICTLY